MRAQRARTTLWLLGLALPLCLLHATASGTVPISLPEAAAALGRYLQGESVDQAAVIIGQIRLPRSLLAMLVGAMLGMTGAAMQGLFRNPLADPSLIGVTAGAALGASMAIAMAAPVVAGVGALGVVSIGAFAGGMLAVILVYKLATSGGMTSVATMLLAGIAISALSAAASNILEFYSSNEILRRISMWRMGGLDGANYPRVIVALVATTLLVTTLPRFANALNALLLGESEARYLGINIEFAKRCIITLAAIGVGFSVALAGVIGFVGLVVPHIMRMLIGPDHRYLLPASGLAGAILLMLADTLSRTIVAPTELPVGVVTAAIGVPFFISLLRRRRDYGML
ncbi:iron ABC transporter permease [Halioglobus sp. HI00S01]|uniref:FecCD family ABC transporter permease n=1 Tax=Halioglobus sp. HI00S01 TaxID=1822214 RepID=UPI0007C37230|nr:iron chelate uptake ABC transporter family permease subunit [Halioglobus sp. HI00S01]KZX59005.1 iron ABC transporter permease [Halioglobus sp. HI00S01]